MGLGEAPLLRQCTFSLWTDTNSMVAYAQTGAHKVAIVAAYKNDYFAESMFVRMRVLSMSGVWQSKSYDVPLEVQHV
jgi:spheroidene monooxygenase